MNQNNSMPRAGTGPYRRFALGGQLGLCRLIGLLLLFSTVASGQGFVLDEGVKPVPITYRESQEDDFEKIGEIRYEVVLENGRQQNQSIDSFYFAEAESAKLALKVTPYFDRPNSKKMRDLRVIFSREGFASMGRNSWKYAPAAGAPLNILLAHGESKTFRFRINRNGVVNFNLPFITAEKDAPFTYWELPAQGTLRNRILSRQIRVVGVLTAEDKLWRRGENAFAGVAEYLRAYPQGKYSREGGRRFTSWLDADYDRLVIANTSGSSGPRKFIDEYTPFADFKPVADYLAEARQVLAGFAAKPVAPAEDRPVRQVRPRSRPTRVATPPVEEDALGGDPGYRFLPEQDGVQVIKLYNFRKPAYYDIYGGLLEIDTRDLVSDSLLYIRQLKQGRVNLLVIERGQENRYVNIELDNVMDVGMSFDSILSQYTFEIEGGIEPYQLYLRPLEDQRYDWGMDQIENQRVSVPLYDLQRAGLEGRYLAQVSSAGSSRPLTLSKVILTVPKMAGNNTWIYPVLLALGVGIFALLLLAVLKRAGRSRTGGRRRHRNQRVRI